MFWGGHVGLVVFLGGGGCNSLGSKPSFLFVALFLFFVFNLFDFGGFLFCFESKFQCLPFFLLSLLFYLFLSCFIFFIFLFLCSVFFIFLSCFGVCLSCLVSLLLFHEMNFGGCLS